MQIADIDFCEPHDLGELYAIETECFESPWEQRLLENDLANPGRVVYVKAVFKDRIVGYGAVAREEQVVHLLNLAVLEEFRRQGVASQLMIAFGEIAAEWSCRRMRLEVRSSNRGARDFYSRLGFDYKTRLHGYYADGEDALVLVARLPLVIT